MRVEIPNIQEIKEAVREVLKEELNILNSSSNMDKALSKKQAAEYLNVSASTIDNLRRNGEIRSHKVRGKVIILQSDIEYYLSA